MKVVQKGTKRKSCCCCFLNQVIIVDFVADEGNFKIIEELLFGFLCVFEIGE